MTSSRPLTVRQERRIRDFLDDKLLDISRNYRKRSEPSTKLPTLISYLDATRPLLALILQIPPVVPSISLRTVFLLRLTNDALTAVTGYAVPSGNGEDLEALLDWLDDFDRAWVVVIKGQVWDPKSQKEEDDDLEISDDEDNLDSGMDVDPGPPASGTSNGTAESSNGAPSARTTSQTERTRLRSLVLSFSSRLEEWLSLLDEAPSIHGSSITSPTPSAVYAEPGVTTVLEEDSAATSNGITDTISMEAISERRASGPGPASTDTQARLMKRLSLETAFNDIFAGTMNALGDLGGIVIEGGEEVKVC